MSGLIRTAVPDASAGLAAAVLAALTFAAPAGAAVDDTILVSRVGPAGPAADHSSQFPAISADGRIVSFDTDATNLGGPPGFYAKDVTTGVLQRLDATDARSGSQQPRLADSGRFACFIGRGSAADSDQHAFVREIGGAQSLRDAGPATLAAGVQNANDFDYSGKNCDVSDDGSKLAYATLVSHDPADAEAPTSRAATDVYVHDFSTGADTLVSRADGPGGADGDNYSVAPELSPDGRYVLFRSRAGNLSAENDDSVADLYRRDLMTGSTVWVSRADGVSGGPGTPKSNPVNATSGTPSGAMSDDGRQIAMETFMVGLDPSSVGGGSAQVVVRDVLAGTTRNASVGRDADGRRVVLTGNQNNPTISGDGSLVGFGGANSGIDPTATVYPNTEEEFLRSVPGDRTSLITRVSGVLGNAADAQSYASMIASDGGFDVFASEATNLSAQDVDGIGGAPPTTGNLTSNVRDIFVRVLAPGRPLVADLGGRPAVGRPILLTSVPTQVTPVQRFAIPAPITKLLGTKTVTTAVASAATAPRALKVRLEEYGILTLALERVKPGVRVGRTCRPAARTPRSPSRRCTRYVRVRRVSLAGYEGLNTFSLAPLLGSRRLTRGTYRIQTLEYDLGRRIGRSSKRFEVR